jgi:hypothetical protein
MMQGTEGQDPSIAGFECPGPRLGEGEMMGMRRLAPTDQAGLTGDIFEMLPVAEAFLRPDRQYGLIDAWAKGPPIGAGR